MSGSSRERLRISLLSLAEGLPPLGRILYHPSMHQQAQVLMTALRNRLPLAPMLIEDGAQVYALTGQTFIITICPKDQSTVEDQVGTYSFCGCSIMFK